MIIQVCVSLGVEIHMEGQIYPFFENVWQVYRTRCSDNLNHKKVIICGYPYEFSRVTSYQFVVVIECFSFLFFLILQFLYKNLTIFARKFEGF